ncbi:MAG: 50S ribosomal protein L18 [Candidatus Zixiibacteriota bacterium]
MNIKKRNKLKRKRILSIRLNISGTEDRPRLCVYRSLKHIYAQLIDDVNGKTLASYSSIKPDVQDEIQDKKKTEQAAIVGEKLGKIAIEKGIKKAVFDRRGVPYMGRVKALADGARKAGLKF